MELNLRPLSAAERNYTYSQSQQISMQTGCIGHLRADMDSNGEGFFSSWDDFRVDLKTQEFKDELDSVINELREKGNILSNRSALSKYCYSHPDASFGKDLLGHEREFGVRVDTDKFAYMMRLNPNKGEYNLYCYCYVREWLDHHLKQAERGIRFIDPHYKELFRIPDGDKIMITLSDGEKLLRPCRYIDEAHVEVGSNLYHICEFAERMERAGNTVIPFRSTLPGQCMSILPSTGEPIILKLGEQGYTPSTLEIEGKTSREMVDLANGEIGVTKAQEAAMLAGSLFGWQTPAADPKNYDEHGQPIRPKSRDRGDSR